MPACPVKKCWLLTAVTATAGAAHAVPTADDILADIRQAEALSVRARARSSAVVKHDIRISLAGAHPHLTSRAWGTVQADVMDATVRATHITSIRTEQETGDCERDCGPHFGVGADSSEQLQNVAIR